MIEYKNLGWVSIDGPTEFTEEVTMLSIRIIKGIYSFADERWLTEDELNGYKEYRIDNCNEKVSKLERALGMSNAPIQSFINTEYEILTKWEGTVIQYEEFDFTPDKHRVPNPF